MLQILFYILIGVFSLIFLFGFVYKKISGVCTCKNQLHGKTVIVHRGFSRDWKGSSA
ncbi:Synaptosomal-associated protein 25 [Armadillidium vulgare]|nr:Synaptosomal-associated protein 25 [Armadillidium vulgare]